MGESRIFIRGPGLQGHAVHRMQDTEKAPNHGQFIPAHKLRSKSFISAFIRAPAGRLQVVPGYDTYEEQSVMNDDIQEVTEASSTVDTLAQDLPLSPESEASAAGNDRSNGKTLPEAHDATLFLSEPTDTSHFISGPPDEETLADLVPTGEWSIGDMIDSLYEIEDIYEKGGMGRVYRVHHREWNMDLAMKSLRTRSTDDILLKNLFLNECEGWVNLGLHPHIVSCYYVREIEGQPRIFSEFMEGGSLDELLEEGKVTTLSRAVDLAIQCLEGLAFAHAKGMVHRDIKPDNCLLTKDGELKISDFGIAAGLIAQGSEEPLAYSPVKSTETMVTPGGGGGTPAYMPPEQWNPGDGATGPWSDMYALGIMLFEMCCGERPFDEGGEELSVLRHRHLNVEPPDPREIRNDIPESLSRFIQRCLRKKTEERFQESRAARDELAAIYRELTEKEYPHAPQEEIRLQSDGLNNRALSLLDLRKEEEALSLWEEALKTTPHHLESTYNRSLFLWKKGRMSDDEVVTTLNEVRSSYQDTWLDEYLLGLVHAERGAYADAVSLLESIEDCGREDVQKTLGWLRPLLSKAPGCVRSFRVPGTEIRSVAISEDGRQLYAGSMNKTIKMFDADTGDCVRTFSGHTDMVNSLALSDDGNMLLSCGDQTVRLWDTATGTCLKVLQGHRDGIHSVAMSPDGKWGLSGSADSTVKLWDLAAGTCARTLEGHSFVVKSVTLSPDARYALSASMDLTLRLWDLATGACIHILSGHEGFVMTVSFSPDGRHAISGASDKTLMLWDLEGGKCLHTFSGHTATVCTVAFSPDGKEAISAGLDSSLRLWDVQTGSCLHSFSEQKGAINSLAFSGQGTWALSGASDSTIKLWRLGLEPSLRAFRAPFHLSRITSSSESAELRIRFEELINESREALNEGSFEDAFEALRKARSLKGFGRLKESLDLWNEAGSHLRKKGLRGAWRDHVLKGHGSGVNALAMSADGTRILSGSSDGTMKLWDRASGDCLVTFEGTHSELNPIHAVALSKDGTRALSGHNDSMIRLWDTATGEHLKDIRGHDGIVNCLAFLQEGRKIISGSQDHLIKLWETNSGLCLATFQGHSDMVTSLSLSADEEYLLSGSCDTSIILWEVRAGRKIDARKDSDRVVAAVSLSEDGKKALTGSYDKSMKLWDLSSSRRLTTFQGHENTVISVALTADGKWALSAGLDQRLKIWDLEKGSCLRTLEGHTNHIKAAVLTPDGRWAVSAGDDGAIFTWELDWDFNTADEQEDTAGYRASTQGIRKATLTLESLSAPEGTGLTATISFRASDSKERETTAPAAAARPVAMPVAEKAAEGATMSPSAMSAPSEPRPAAPHQKQGSAPYSPEKKAFRKALRQCFLVRAMEGHMKGISSLAISGCGQWALSGDYESRLRFWNLRDGKMIRELEGHSGIVSTVAISPDGRRGLSGSWDETMKLWDLGTGKCLHTFTGTSGIVRSVAFSPDGRWAVSGDTGNIIRIWDLETGTVIAVRATSDDASAVSFSAEGRWLIAADRNQVLMWDMTGSDSSCSGRFSGHTKPVRSSALSPDRKWLITGSEDSTVRLWEVSTEKGKTIQPTRTFEGHHGSVTSVALSHDGQWAFSEVKTGFSRSGVSRRAHAPLPLSSMATG